MRSRWPALDRLKGHPSFYRRQVISLADGVELESYLLLRAWERERRGVEEKRRLTSTLSYEKAELGLVSILKKGQPA